MQVQARPAPDRLGRLREAAADEEDARVCRDIAEEACRVVPRNFALILVSGVLTQLGDLLSSPKTVLAWLLAYLQAPAFLIAFLVPIRESGSMVPQLVIASYVRRLPRRKRVWVAGSLLQCAAVVAMGVTAATARGALAGWLIMLWLVIFSLARGLNSVASKDVLGKTIPMKRRGRLTGLAASCSGLVAAAFGLTMLGRSAGTTSPAFFGALLAAAGALWLVAAVTYARVEEYDGETGGGANALAEAWRRLDLLRTDRAFRRFVITRALLLCSALSAPYYAVLAQEQHGSGIGLLAAFIIANGAAASLSATIWGVMADASSRRVLIVAATLAAALGIAVFVIATAVPVLRAAYWTYPVAFFVLGVAHSGVRIGRKTYIVDMAGGNRRTDYVAVSNTVIGIILLLTGSIGALSSVLSTAGMILLLSLFGMAGAITGTALPQVE